MSRRERVEPLEKLKIARATAVDAHPYLATGLFKLFPIESSTIKTLAVSANWTMYFNPNFVEETANLELAGVLIHELSHLLRGHHQRERDFRASDSFIWNIAADAAINDDLLRSSIKLPDQKVTSTLLGIEEGQSTEAIYLQLSGRRAELENMFPDIDCGSCSDGSTRSYEEESITPKVENTEVLLDQIAREVLEGIKDGANPPPFLRTWATDRIKPQVNWLSLLLRRVRRELDPTQRADYRLGPWSRRNSDPFIFPKLVGRSRPNVAVIVDTSGSMREAELNQAITEISSILNSLRGDPLTLISCDSEVRLQGKIRNASQIQLKGGGSTDLRVGIEAALKLKPIPNLIVVMTDGLTKWAPNWPRHAPEVIALLTAGEVGVPKWVTPIIIK
jgi:predicted metal-dependent peptidase